jgi:hypothetical protein
MEYFKVIDRDTIYCETCATTWDGALAYRRQGALSIGAEEWWDKDNYNRQELECCGCGEAIAIRYPDAWGAYDSMVCDDRIAKIGHGDNQISIDYEHVIGITDHLGNRVTYRLDCSPNDPKMERQTMYTGCVSAWGDGFLGHLGDVEWDESFLRSAVIDYVVNERGN